MGYKAQAIKGISWMTLFRLVTRGFSFVRIAIIARVLTPELFGVYGVAALILSLFEIFTETGINVFLIQERANIKKYISTAWVVSIFRSSLIAAVILISTPFVANYFNIESYWYVLASIASVAFIRGFINPARVAFQVELNFYKEFMFSFLIFLIDFTVSVLAVIIFKSPIGIVYGLIAGAVSEVILSFLLIKPWPKLDFEIEKLKQIFGRGKWVTASGIFNYLFSNFDDVVVGRILGVGSLGIYQAAYRISSLPITEVSDVVRSVTFPIFVKFAEDKERLKRAHFASMLLTGAASFAIGIFIFIFPEFVVKILLGNNWLEAAGVLRILALFGVVRSLTIGANSLFNSVKKQKYMAYFTLASFLILLITIFPLINLFGLAGAGYSVLLGSVAGFLVSIYLTFKII